jgi:antirestriction protein ArdC
MTSYKPLSERVAAKMATDLKTGNSVFQRPNNGPNAAMPFNIESGNKYGGPSALVLLMQKRDDPRWATSNQANRNHTAVNKGATATWISFMSNYEIQKVFEGDKPVMRDDGKTQRTERVKLDEPKLVEAALFNGEQLRKLDKWEKPHQEVSPAERAEVILKNSGVNIEHDGDEMSYRKGTDSIVIPEPNQFANHEQYLSEALHQLVHRELENQQESTEVGMVKPELRTNIASLFLAKEIGLPFELNYHDGYANSWAQVLKDEPGELFKAAEDAQNIVDKVLSFELQVEQKQDAGQEQSEDQQSTDVVKSEANNMAKHDPDKLTKGEVIPYNGTEYKVVAELKNKVYQMEEVGNKRKFKMSSKDELFSSLLNARNNSQEIVSQKAAELNGHEHQGEMAETIEQDFEAENNQYYSR